MDEDSGHPTHSRRRMLGMAGGVAMAPLFGGLVTYRTDPGTLDIDEDGIPDETKRDADFDRELSAIFGAQYGGLELGRRDLLLDVRYVGDVTVPLRVKRALVERFRENEIHLQWLDHPAQYELDWFEDRYGHNARKILWSRDSFYRNEIEETLKNVAFQLIMVPGVPDGRFRGRIYSPWSDVRGTHTSGYVNGMNFGNRAVAGERHHPWEQARLIFHEIAHLALCHDDDPENTGVMGTNETLTLTDAEWDAFRAGLDNVRDATGYDLLLRPCLWADSAGIPTDTGRTCAVCGAD